MDNQGEPEQNGVAERFNRTIEERVRATLSASRLPIKLWPEVSRAVVYVYNRSPHAFHDNLRITMIDPDHHTKPDLSHLRVIGSYAISHVLKDRDHKLSLAGERIVCLGYSDTGKGYRLWNPLTDDIVERFDVDIDDPKRDHPADFNRDNDVTTDNDIPIDTVAADDDAEYIV